MSGTYRDVRNYFMKELYKNTSISFYDQLYFQVPSWFKKINRQKRRAKIKQELRNHNYDCIPIFKKEDVWLWW